MTIDTNEYQELLHAYCLAKRYGTDADEQATYAALRTHIDAQLSAAPLDQQASTELDERALTSLKSIEERLALIYRLCCGTAPKQSVGELLDVTLKMPEWQSIRSAITAKAGHDKRGESAPIDGLANVIAEKVAQIKASSIPLWSYCPTDAQRYQRLRILGAAPGGSQQLTGGTVMRFQSLDDFLNADIAAYPSRGEATTAATLAHGASTQAAPSKAIPSNSGELEAAQGGGVREGLERWDYVIGDGLVPDSRGEWVKFSDLAANPAPSAAPAQPTLMRQAVASVASNVDGEVRLNWMRSQRVEAGRFCTAPQSRHR